MTGGGNESRATQVEGLGQVNREEVGQEAGSVRRSHEDTRGSIYGGFGSDPSGEDV